jgi:hypothetical protein
VATTPFDGILKRLANQDIILPHLESAVMADNWPAKYFAEIDSTPYYGLGDGYFHPSSHPMLDERQLYYMFHPDTRDQMIPERRNLGSHIILSVASAIHATLQTQMRMSGLVTSDEDVEYEYVNDEHHVRGRIDFIATHPNGLRYVVEFKTCHPYVFKRLEGIPMDKWKAQLNIGMDNSGVDNDTGILMVMESGSPYPLHEMHIQKDQQLLDDIYGKFDRVRAAIASDTIPRHCCNAGSPEMKKCPARGVCWLKEDE